LFVLMTMVMNCLSQYNSETNKDVVVSQHMITTLCVCWYRQLLQVPSRHSCAGFRLVSAHRSSLKDSAAEGTFPTQSCCLQ